ncbi:uncharacterized protein [Physcomitrium patens]|uniref:TPX2 C-terminal domain-containing protein n=1 Tax=Physcomitrium patens TaxID=3218 RepID=A0A2K1IYL4_PHYPA|nr:serine/arginine repetitive matrix protein 1-like [Physcomitrium patens]XP_024403789.1 serine/arginine repetitive matrix protein 1-like [Physcomitrium patens]XP_024403790.1 serine/arginine repetitive matrix protein 1-like [Physcomitrium patens]PNR34368.1 hypothetical protein PHYPA_024185 [Physcomitrium patens]|eukprot:XP_024403788.1 serine/arginine repetitive matrix protein 1-like [Physcomitrella patens]
MEQDGATDVVVRNRNYNIKPASVVLDTQPASEEIAFPEFAFPVNDGGAALNAWKAVSTAGQGQSVQTSNGNCKWGFLQSGNGTGDESPKRMPLAFRSKHVETTVESSPNFPGLATEPATKQCLSPLATFKDLDLTHENGKVEILEKSGGDVLSTPTRKSLSVISTAENDAVAAPSTPKGRGLSLIPRVARLQSDADKTPDRLKPVTPNLQGKASVGTRGSLTSPRGEERGRALSPAPDRRSLTSPRRTVPDRSRSPVPFRNQDRSNYGVSRSLSPVLTGTRTVTPTRRPTTPRSTSPAPRSREDSNSSRAQWNGNTKKSTSMPSSPRYITPTRAASLKAVNSPPSPNGSVSKELQYPTASGSTTPQRDFAKRGVKEAHSKTGEEGQPTPKIKSSPPTLTQPTGFKFSTDERSEKRRDFYSKLEEKMKLKEEERKRLEAKAQEEKESQLRELRKTLTYKANPVPKFYQEPPPPPVKIKKAPTTRAKSPNFTAPRRRDSCSGSIGGESHSHGGSSPLRGRLVRSPSLESNVSSQAKVAAKVKQPFKPI